MPRQVKVSEVMNADVITVGPETSVRAVARLLSRHRITAVPVVDETGTPLGIVSESDLMPRSEAEREQRRSWWLRLLAEGEELNDQYLAEIEKHSQTVREVMSAPVITVPEAASLGEIADVLWANRINRVPVMRDGRIVGIVSRSDLIRAFAYPDEFSGASAEQPVADSTADAKPGSDAFHDLVHRVARDKDASPDHEGSLPWEKRPHGVVELLALNLSDANWNRLLRSARHAAGRGEKEYLLLRFPSELCTDRSRAINASDPGWPDTLRGVAAQIYARWNTELRPMGLRLTARVISFPGGIPGDVGLFLKWGDRPHF